MMELLNIAGGVAIVLFAVRFLRKGLDRLFGSQLWIWVERFARRPLGGLCTGAAVSVVTPSSTGMSLFAVQAVQSGYLTPRQMLAVVLGADIGLTAIIQLAAFNIEEIVPVFCLAGVIMFQFMSNTKVRGVGQILLSLGLLFLGIGMMKHISRSLDPAGDFASIVAIATHYPWLVLLLATVVSFVVQSSTATVALLIGLSQGATPLSLPLAITVVLGANLGTALTMALFGWSHASSRRLAASCLFMKALSCAAALLLMPFIVDVLEMHTASMANKIADVHTGFNIAKALIGLPLIAPVILLMDWLIPEPAANPKMGPKYLSPGPIESVALAEGQTLREISRVSEFVRGMLNDVWLALQTNDEKLVRSVSSRDDHIDLLDREIKLFLTRLSSQGLDHHEATEQMRQLRCLSELETVGDIIDKNLCELVQKKIKLGAEFSREGWEDLTELFKCVSGNALIAETAFQTRNRVLARQLLDNKRELDERVRRLRDRHFARLNQGRHESHQTSAIHLDILTNLKRINSHVSHVAYAILEPIQMARPAATPAKPAAGRRWLPRKLEGSPTNG
jgi:phosphate:Na+ symporter